MAVQAQHLSHHAFRAMDDATVRGPAFLDELAGCAAAAAVGARDTTRLRDFPRSDLTACDYGLEPRKRARVADGFMVVDAPQLVMQEMAQVPAGDAPCRALASGAASTSGRAANVAGVSSGGVLSRLYETGAEIDEVIRLESERMRAGLEVARRRHARALLSLAQRAASGRLRAAEAELERVLRRNAELEDRARQAAAECHGWMGIARSHETVAAGLRATLDQLLLQSPCAAAGGEAGDAEDAQSCCFEAPSDAADVNDDDGAASGARAASSPSCRACGGGEACVLLLPCRHLCLCRACEPAAHACPVCANAKNASLHVLLC